MGLPPTPQVEQGGFQIFVEDYYTHYRTVLVGRDPHEVVAFLRDRWVEMDPAIQETYHVRFSGLQRLLTPDDETKGERMETASEPAGVDVLIPPTRIDKLTRNVDELEPIESDGVAAMAKATELFIRYMGAQLTQEASGRSRSRITEVTVEGVFYDDPKLHFAHRMTFTHLLIYLSRFIQLLVLLVLFHVVHVHACDGKPQ